GIEAVGPKLAQAPVRVTPDLALDAHWEDPRTLVLRPSEAFAPGQRYYVELAGSLANASGELARNVDVTPLRVQWLGIDTVAAPHVPTFTVGFSRDVDPSAVVAQCALVDVKGHLTALRLPTVPAAVPADKAGGAAKPGAAPTDRFSLTVVSPLALDTDYHVT